MSVRSATKTGIGILAGRPGGCRANGLLEFGLNDSRRVRTSVVTGGLPVNDSFRKGAIMRAAAAVVASGLIILGAGSVLAGADTEPVIVVPGRPGVPVIVNGQDVSGAVIEGDWGLARPQIGITIIRRRPLLYGHIFAPPLAPPVAGYFPRTGRPPRVGRLEILPPANRALPPPVPSLERTWEVHSAPLPPTADQPNSYYFADPNTIPARRPMRSAPRRPPRTGEPSGSSRTQSTTGPPE